MKIMQMIMLLFLVIIIASNTMAQANCDYVETGIFYPILIQDVTLTPCNAVVEIGDVICVLDEGLPVGSYEIISLDSSITISAWEKDDSHQLPGFTLGNIIEYKYYDASAGLTYDMEATYSMGDGTFGDGSFAAVSNLQCDITKPEITCPEHITIQCDESIDPSVTGTATATDNCDDTPVISYEDVQAGNVITRTWTATDASGNSINCDQLITINGPLAPVLLYPKDNASNVPLPITFSWEPVQNANIYELEISYNSDFVDLLYTKEVQDTTHEVTELEEHLDYHWRVKAHNDNCGWGEYGTGRFGSGTYAQDVQLNSIEELPTDFTLSQNHPNPFNPVTTIEFTIPGTEYVSLEIYNVLGGKIETLVSEVLSAGSWSVTWDGKDMASGLYFYKINAGDYTNTRKMILLK